MINNVSPFPPSNNKIVSNGYSTSHKVTAIISKRPATTVNKIKDIVINPSSMMVEGVANVYVEKFRPEEGGYYHVSTQCGIKLTGTTSVGIDYMQMGICDAKLENNSEHFISRILSAEVEPGHVLCDTITAVMKLDAGVEYVAWVNLGSDDNSKFLLEKQYTHLRLYKL